MVVSEIFALLDEIAPFALQESWDNSGLQLGSLNNRVESIQIALDLDLELLQSLPERSLVLLHHPLLFQPLRFLDTATYPANLIALAIQKQLTIIALHTNFDHAHLNLHLAREILGLPATQEGLVCHAELDWPFDSLLSHITQRLARPPHKLTRACSHIQRVSIICGAGGSMQKDLLSDCLITGDVKYHDAFAALSRGISLIDIGHYESECHFAPLLAGLLQERGLPSTPHESLNPFVLCD